MNRASYNLIKTFHHIQRKRANKEEAMKNLLNSFTLLCFVFSTIKTLGEEKKKNSQLNFSLETKNRKARRVVEVDPIHVDIVKISSIIN
jgi:hypothetical protein